MPFLDFNTLLICNNDFSEDSIKATFELFKNVGVKNFIFTYDYDRDLKPISSAIAKFRTLKPYLNSLAPRGVKIYTAFNLILSEGLVYDASFKRFSFGNGNRIFISLPYDDCSDWIETDMNHLLYKNKQKPLFVHFETIRTLPNVFARFTDIKSAMFSLDINYITAISATDDIKEFIDRSINIIPCIKHNVFEYVGVLKSFSMFQNRIAIRNRFDLYNIFHNSARELIKDSTFYSRSKG